MSEYKGAAVERAEVTAIAEQVVAALGTDWSVEQPHEGNRGVYLVGPGQEKLWLARGWDSGTKTRLVIHGDYPGTETFRHENHEITVAESRPPAAIAKEIERRLLPKYRDTLAEVIERLDRQRQAQQARDVLAGHITEAVGPKVTQVGYDNDDKVSIGGKTFGHFRLLHHAQDVNIELYGVSPEVAVEIARLLGR